MEPRPSSFPLFKMWIVDNGIIRKCFTTMLKSTATGRLYRFLRHHQTTGTKAMAHTMTAADKRPAIRATAFIESDTHDSNIESNMTHHGNTESDTQNCSEDILRCPTLQCCQDTEQKLSVLTRSAVFSG